MKARITVEIAMTDIAGSTALEDVMARLRDAMMYSTAKDALQVGMDGLAQIGPFDITEGRWIRPRRVPAVVVGRLDEYHPQILGEETGQ